MDSVERTRRGFRAFAEGDVATILELLDEGVVWRIPGPRGDRALELDQALVVRVDDGRWVEVDAVPFDQHAFDEFWS